VEAASITTRSRRVEALFSPDGPGPLLALFGGALLITIGAGLIAAHVTVFALDESLIQQSAVHYSSNLPHSLLHDLDARATNRLYSLVLSIAYRLTGGPAAVRIDHLLSVAMFVSAAFPIYLMARVLLNSRWSAVAVALLSVAVPWLTLTSALFTENLSYPIFWWVMLALCAAVWQPGAWRDLLALVSIALLVGTRVQFAALFIGYLPCLLAVSVWRAPGGVGVPRRLARGAVEAARRFPFTIAILVVVLVGLLYARTSGQWHAHVERLLGSYSNVIIRNGLPPNMAEGVLVELIALALGIGLLPVIVSIPWYLGRLGRPRLERRWIHLAVVGFVLTVFLILTVYSQGGYLGAITEERYFFYVVPVFWIGVFAALSEGRTLPRDMFTCALVLAALFATIPFLSPLTEETAFLAPVESIVPHVLTQRIGEVGLTGLSIEDALAFVTLAAGLLTWLVWSRWPSQRARWAIGVAALVQLLTAGYAFAVIDGKVQGIQGRTAGSSKPLGWVDEHAHGQSVTWLENLPVDQPPAIDVAAAGLAADQAHVTLFWNSQISDAATVPATDPSPLEFPLSALPFDGALSVGTSNGALAPASLAAGLRTVVGAKESPFLQLAGSTLALSPDRYLALTRVASPARAIWMTTGLAPDAVILGGASVQARAWAPNPSAGGPVTLDVRMTLLPPALPAGVTSAPQTGVMIELGGVSRRVSLTAGSGQRQIELRTCASSSSGGVTGTLRATRTFALDGRELAGALVGVSVDSSPAARGTCASHQRADEHGTTATFSRRAETSSPVA
jgi:hypothetical protein